MATRDDWPLGPALKAARELSGLSARKAATRTRGLVSSGRWYQLESGVQKTKGQEVPIGTTPETVIAAALAVGWDVDEALRIAGMSASESVVRAIETKMFGSQIRADLDDPDWLLYLEALLEYIDNHQELPASDIATLILECEFLAREALEARPSIQSGIDESIAYGSKLNELLTQLRDKQRHHQHGQKETSDGIAISDATEPRAPGEAKQGEEAGGDEEVVRSLRPAHWDDVPPPPPIELADAASVGHKESDKEDDASE